MIKKIRTFILKLVRQRQLNTLHKHIYSGAVFLRILNDELVKLPRHKRKRFVRALYKDCKISDEIIKHCEIKSEYMIKTMKGQLKVFKRKKQVERKAQRKTGKKDVKKMIHGAEEIKPNKAIKPDEVLAGGQPYTPERSGLPKVEKAVSPKMKISKSDQAIDGEKFYKDLKAKEARGELKENKDKEDK